MHLPFPYLIVRNGAKHHCSGYESQINPKRSNQIVFIVWFMHSNPPSCVSYVTKNCWICRRNAIFTLEKVICIYLFHKFVYINCSKKYTKLTAKQSISKSGISRNWYIIFEIITIPASNEMIPLFSFGVTSSKKQANTTRIFINIFNAEIWNKIFAIFTSEQ